MRENRLAYIAVLLLFLTSCVDSERSASVTTGHQGSAQVQINIGGAPLDSSRVAVQRRVDAQQAIDQVYPYPGKVTLAIFGHDSAGATIGALAINRDYNESRFAVDAGGALIITENSFLLNVPNGYFLSFTITFYNSAGYQYFQGGGDYDGTSGAAAASVTIPIAVAVDPLLPQVTPPDICVDSDSDTLCDVYEDLFINVAGVADVDGDGLLNSLDSDSDGDGQFDLDEGNAPSNDGFPRFIHANQAPTAVSAQLSAIEGQPSAPTPALVTDPDVGDTHTILVVGQPSNGAAWSNVSNELNYTSNTGFSGTDSFAIEATDQGGLSVQGIATVTVTADTRPNSPPLAQNDSATVDSGASVSIDVLANDSDADGDALSIVSFTQGSNGTVTQSGNLLSYSAAAAFVGTDSFSYTVTDGRLSATATVSVTVSAPPLAALVAVDDAATMAEDGSALVHVLQNDSADASATLTVVSVTAPSNGTATIISGLSIDYVPNADFNGSDSFSYTVEDGLGGSATATVNITVTPVNDPPVATADSVSAVEDVPLTISGLLNNDSDVDGDTLSISAVDASTSRGGILVNNGDGTIDFTPQTNVNGIATFNYTVSDGNGGSATATVSINIAPVNDPPTAVTDNVVNTGCDSTTVYTVLANDSDPEGNALSVTGVHNGAGLAGYSAFGMMVFVNQDNTIHYDGGFVCEGFLGQTDTFYYTVSDGLGGVSTGTVRVLIQ